MRKLGFSLLAMFGLVLSVSAAMAGPAPAPSSSEVVTLVSDPYLDAGVVSTSIYMAPKCPCTISNGCSYQPVGTQCADEIGCCHCYGPDPALRKCVGTIN